MHAPSLPIGRRRRSVALLGAALMVGSIGAVSQLGLTGAEASTGGDCNLPNSAVQMVRKGKAGTYANDPKTGVVDSGDNNRPALAGASNNRPGIAMYNRNTLGGWWLVEAPGGLSSHGKKGKARQGIIQQTDIGPAPWTGRVVDINAVAAREVFGLRQGNAFPTDQGTWTMSYLGRKKPAGAFVTRESCANAYRPTTTTTTTRPTTSSRRAAQNPVDRPRIPGTVVPPAGVQSAPAPAPSTGRPQQIPATTVPATKKPKRTTTTTTATPRKKHHKHGH